MHSCKPSIAHAKHLWNSPSDVSNCDEAHVTSTKQTSLEHDARTLCVYEMRAEVTLEVVHHHSARGCAKWVRLKNLQKIL